MGYRELFAPYRLTPTLIYGSLFVFVVYVVVAIPEMFPGYKLNDVQTLASQLFALSVVALAIWVSLYIYNMQRLDREMEQSEQEFVDTLDSVAKVDASAVGLLSQPGRFWHVLQMVPLRFANASLTRDELRGRRNAFEELSQEGFFSRENKAILKAGARFFETVTLEQVAAIAANRKTLERLVLTLAVQRVLRGRHRNILALSVPLFVVTLLASLVSLALDSAGSFPELQLRLTWLGVSSFLLGFGELIFMSIGREPMATRARLRDQMGFLSERLRDLQGYGDS